MKKLVLSLSFIVLICTNVFAASDKYGILTYVQDFYTYSEAVKFYMIQDETEANNSCGPTSLMFIYNYYMKKRAGLTPDFAKSVPNAIDELESVYDYLGKPYNSYTSLDELKSVAINHYYLTNAKRMSSSSGITKNIGYLINYLNYDMPCLIVLSKYYYDNPVGKFDHIVIVYAYQKLKDSRGNSPTSINNDRQNDRIYYYDPFFGGSHYFVRSEISTAVNLTGFAFLKVSP